MNTKPILYSYALLLLPFLFCLSSKTNAQLQANFTIDKPGGCSPLSVQFTNTSTGTSGTTTYQWTFGNGNSSALANPGATYYDEKTYTVSLTAKDGATISTKTLQFTVYKKPTVDFSVSPAKGCVPLPVNFTSNATPGDGTISKYFWDFGDGATEQGSSSSTAHIYIFGQKPPIGLTVTNSFGCYTTVSKNNQVEAFKPVKAVFQASAIALCSPGDEVSFTNTSTGSGVLSYTWDFGDGKNSAEQSPKHVFSNKGVFTVKLNAKSSDGCSGDASPIQVNVANFVADFEMATAVCLEKDVTFYNKSTAGQSKLEWFIDDNWFYANYEETWNRTFYQARDYDIKLVATYGLCQVTTVKKLTVKPLPQPNGFLVDIKGACGVPITIDYKDTTRDAVKWEWQHNYNYGSTETFGTGQAASFNYQTGTGEYVYLTVTNKEGCSASTSKSVYYDQAPLFISTNIYDGRPNCVGYKVDFYVTGDSLIKTFLWDFGDGTTSSEKRPVHTFNKPGTYQPTLEYTTIYGCTGKLYTSSYIGVTEKPVFDFTVVGSTTVCGNTPTLFTTSAVNLNYGYEWFVNDTSIFNLYTYSFEHKFEYDTVYTIKVIASLGSCRDTVIKKDYIKVLPPFPHIVNFINTCEGTRGDVRFTETSKKAVNWSWNFGDGSPNLAYNTYKDTIRHTFTKTGRYNVVLSTTNGPCTVKDSIFTNVLLKQKPLLSSPQTDVCSNELVHITLSNYEANPNQNPYNVDDHNYRFKEIQYGDLSTFVGGVILVDYYYALMWEENSYGTVSNLEPGKNDFRILSVSDFFNCEDTTNFIQIRIHGPKAGFIVQNNNGCFKRAISFQDTSHAFKNVPIVKWEWDFGDNSSETYSTGDIISHSYKSPGYYLATLTVTDADGCTNTTDYNLHSISLSGPKADFNASSYDVAPNTVVYFYNSSISYDSYSSTLKWLLPDGSVSYEQNPTFNFIDEGLHDVKLITTNLTTGCPDTAVKTVRVRKVNSAFTYTLSYLNNNNCPPVLARFTSVSANAVRLDWDFGDGGTGGDQQIVSHTYNAAGIYRVVHYSYDANDAVDSTEDFIEVKGPYALLKADTLYACNALQVKLSADVRNAQDFTWDFGDGTLTAGTDTFATHNYITPGIYRPAVILKDQGGCTATSSLPDKIVVDSLSAVFTPVPAAACNTASVQFTPQVYSLSQSQLQTTLQYRWITTENSKTDTFYTEIASNMFTQTGQHNIALQVTSPYGCLVTTTGKVDVKQGVKAFIEAPLQICKNETASFKGTSLPASGNLTWSWNFGNNQTSNLQNPLSQKFTTAGQQPISLVVSNGNCNDTALFILPVQEIPKATFTLSKPVLCLGDSMTITAGGGATYQWINTSFIQNANQPTATVWPANNTFYTVKVTNGFGCNSQDSVEVRLIKPFQLTVQTPLFACAGNSVQLNASGADKYQWTPAASLSNLNIANPVSSTTVSASYSVVGYDNYNCFTDTKKVDITIGKLPSINAGPDFQVIGGSEVKLATSSSSDVVTWTWQPIDFLSCTNCASPVSRPNTPMVYVVTASTAEGCSAKDTVRIELICKSDLVYIPTGFTPNGDNLNERFVIHGSGIKSIVHFVVFDRWGKTVFERKNGALADRNSSWDGNANGQPAPSGAYVYLLKLECDGGEIFTYQGTVTLIR